MARGKKLPANIIVMVHNDLLNVKGVNGQSLDSVFEEISKTSFNLTKHIGREMLNLLGFNTSKSFKAVNPEIAKKHKSNERLHKFVCGSIRILDLKDLRQAFNSSINPLAELVDFKPFYLKRNENEHGLYLQSVKAASIASIQDKPSKSDRFKKTACNVELSNLQNWFDAIVQEKGITEIFEPIKQLTMENIVLLLERQYQLNHNLFESWNGFVAVSYRIYPAFKIKREKSINQVARLNGVKFNEIANAALRKNVFERDLWDKQISKLALALTEEARQFKNLDLLFEGYFTKQQLSKTEESVKQLLALFNQDRAKLIGGVLMPKMLRSALEAENVNLADSVGTVQFHQYVGKFFNRTKKALAKSLLDALH